MSSTSTAGLLVALVSGRSASTSTAAVRHEGSLPDAPTPAPPGQVHRALRRPGASAARRRASTCTRVQRSPARQPAATAPAAQPARRRRRGRLGQDRDVQRRPLGAPAEVRRAAARRSAASASRASASSRSRSAVRASAAATPGPSSSSSTGSTRWRTRDARVGGVGVGRVVPGGQSRRRSSRRGRSARRGRGAAGGSSPRAAASRPATGPRNRGRGRAAPSPPGRRGCARAGRRRRRCARRRCLQRRVPGGPGRRPRGRPVGGRRRPATLRTGSSPRSRHVRGGLGGDVGAGRAAGRGRR